MLQCRLLLVAEEMPETRALAGRPDPVGDVPAGVVLVLAVLLVPDDLAVIHVARHLQKDLLQGRVRQAVALDLQFGLVSKEKL